MLHWSRLGLLVSFSVILLGCGQKEMQVTPLTEATKLLAQNEPVKAIAKCNEILAIDPTNYDAMVLRGQANSKFDRTNEAIADFTTAIELASDRPDAYRWRYRIYMELAKQEPDSNAKMILEQAAAADHKKLTQYDMNAGATFRNQVTSLPKSLTKPIPGYDPLEQEDDLASEDLKDLDPFKSVEPNTPEFPNLSGEPKEQKFGELDNGSNGPEVLGEETNTQAREEKAGLIAKQKEASGEAEIEQLDLDHGTPEEPTLPPHTGVVPKLPVTRFDRQAFIPVVPGPFDTSTPPLPRRATTGIAKPATQFDDEELQPSGRFFLQNQLGGFGSTVPQKQTHSTGIHSTPAPGLRENTVPGRTTPRFGHSQFGIAAPLSPRTAANQGIPTGFLPPGTQAGIGPRILQDGAPRPSSPGGDAANQGEDATTPFPFRPGVGNPILTTALPGTTVIYGAPRGTRQNANLYAPPLSDPDYSPFVPRPSGIQTTPNLPSR